MSFYHLNAGSAAPHLAKNRRNDPAAAEKRDPPLVSVPWINFRRRGAHAAHDGQN
jgi:hypothetical protein